MGRARQISTVMAVCAALGWGTVLGSGTALAESTASSGTSSATSPALATAVPRLDWRSCGPGLEAFECTLAAVPLDYDHPRGAQIQLALTRLPASGSPQERLGSLFVNPGGPGGSGVDFVQQAAVVAYTPQVRARYDVVGFDPRGVGRSAPATCYHTAAEEQAAPFMSASYPRTHREEARYTATVADLAIRCQAQSPVRFATSSTANVARDLDVLREAVGDERLNYVGYSYGTFLGATYGRLFPDRVGRWVLDGTVDPVAWTGTGSGDAAPSVPLGIRTRQGESAQQTFGEFARLCRQAGPARCPLAALGEPQAVTDALLERLAKHPITVPLPDGGSVLVTEQYLVQNMFFSLYSPSTWESMAQVLAALAAPAPDVARAATAAAQLPGPLGSQLRGEDYPSVGGALASLCVDTAHSNRWWEYPQRADAATTTSGYFGRFRAWAGLPCEFWQLHDSDAYTGPWQQTTQRPVLVIGTRYDPATPYQQTAPFSRLFPQGHLLTLSGWGHTTIGQSRCIDTDVTQYLVDGVLPVDGAACQPDAVPFSGPTPAPDARLLALLRPITAWW